MSQFYEEDVLRAMEEDGTADWIRQVVSESQGDEPTQTAEAPDEDTAEVEEVEEKEVEQELEPVEDEPEAAADDATPLTDEEEDAILLELSPEAQSLLDTKYGGDINKMLNAAPEAQSAIGRQGNELGDLRSEVQQLRQEFAAGMSRSQLVWPDEDAEPEDAVRAYRQIADEAFDQQDATTFGQAMSAWQEIDPLGNEAWATMKATQVMLANAQENAPGTPEPVSLADGVEALKATYPQLSEAAFQQEVGKELERFPTLQRTFQDQTASPSERVAALEEAARLVASRQADGDVRKAVRRVAVSTSEEARASRAAARVATGGGRGKPTESADRQILVGDTGRTVGEKELQAAIKEATGMDVQVGGSTWKPGDRPS